MAREKSNAKKSDDQKEDKVDIDRLLIGLHFANPVAGHVMRSDDSFIFEV